MLHHFTGGNHPHGQGAITSDQFAAMIDFLGRDNFLQPDEWIERSLAGRLGPHDLCITLDDSLLCQYEIAKPVLDSYGIKAFWFVYSSVFEGGLERLELYRHYRTLQFDDVEQFYDRFFATVAASEHGASYDAAIAAFKPSQYLAQFTFYSDGDRQFRFVRDKVLGPAAYFAIMDRMVESDPTYSIADATRLLWMENSHLKQLADEGHVVGLHSFSHPTQMSELSDTEQWNEYSKNCDHLKKTTGKSPRAMSHPCGSYSDATLQILRELGVEIGFVASLKAGNSSLLEQPRNDHSHVAIEMGLR